MNWQRPYCRFFAWMVLFILVSCVPVETSTPTPVPTKTASPVATQTVTPSPTLSSTPETQAIGINLDKILSLRAECLETAKIPLCLTLPAKPSADFEVNRFQGFPYSAIYRIQSGQIIYAPLDWDFDMLHCSQMEYGNLCDFITAESPEVVSQDSVELRWYSDPGWTLTIKLERCTDNQILYSTDFEFYVYSAAEVNVGDPILLAKNPLCLKMIFQKYFDDDSGPFGEEGRGAYQEMAIWEHLLFSQELPVYLLP